MRVLLLSFILCIVTTVFSQTKISGYAPAYLGQTIEVHEIVDFLTMTSRPLAQTTVAADSTFSLEIRADHVQRVKIFAGNNYFYHYVEPNADYTIFIRDRSAYNEIRPSGDEVEFFFLGIDSTDINFKIIDFDAILIRFLQRHYNRKSAASADFVKDFERFKELLVEEYQSDTCSFFKTYVKYAVAGIDNMSFVGSRNRYEKFDFYLKMEPIHYGNDRYMEYVFNYFDKYHQQIGERTNKRFKQAVGLASPSAVMQALSADYALGNYRMREMIMLKMLADVYYLPDYSQSKVITILDSLGQKSLFPETQVMARNLRRRLTLLAPGSRLPDFKLKIDEDMKSRTDFSGKHLYVQFIQANSEKSVQDLPLIRPLIEKYGSAVNVLTVVVMDEADGVTTGDFVDRHGIDWTVSFVTKDHPIIDDFNVATFPHYVLVDQHGYVVTAPALSPRPNNEYETIERIMFQIKKIRDREQRGE